MSKVMDRAVKPRCLDKALVGWMLLLSLLVVAASPAGAEVTYHASSDYALRLGEQGIAEAEIFYSPKLVAYLVLSAGLPRPLLVRIPEQTVTEIPAEAVRLDAEEGTATVAGDVRESALGGIERRSGEIRFELAGAPAALVPAPPIIGWHTPQTIRSADLVLRSGFARAKNKAASKTLVLPPGQAVVVEIFFGSWDDYSQVVMPGIMQLEAQQGPGAAEFRYYGLPRRIADDPLGAERSVHGVPTLIVSVGGEELGRLVGRALYQPAESLQRLLDGELE